MTWRFIASSCVRRTKTTIFSSILFTLTTLALSHSAFAQNVTRGPYLQSGAPDSIVVRWRTDVNSQSVVRYGLSPTALNSVAQATGTTSEHVVKLSGLAPATTYYYSIGTQSQAIAGGDNDHRFVTSPLPGTEQPTRIWVVGDSGEADSRTRAVRDAYLNRTGNQYTNLFLMLGDNAYDDGTDSEYQRAVFETYPSILRQTPVWPTLGNHDGRSANSDNQSGVYYDIFTLPKNGEIGGLASGTEAYYAFDYGNIHFVVLESFETDRSSNGAMMTWLADDLSANTQPWVIAFWHHPPYSKGSHNSDSESRMVQMRENALPLLEAAGVDLVLSGHSHSYERSYLIDGHYGRSGTFNASNQIDGGDGRPSGDGAYEKPAEISAPNQGAVYVVAGSSSKISGGSLNHNAMRVNLNRLGSMILEVNGDTLDATFLDNNGTDLDTFQISKVTAIPEVTLTASDASASELGTTTATFRVSRTGNTSDPLNVGYSVDGSATSGSDYQPLSGEITIAAGQTSADITLVPINDTLLEDDETVRLTLSTDAAYDIGLPNTATATIVSDEIAATLSISATRPLATEAGSSAGEFTINRIGDTTTSITVRYAASGSATSGLDYTALPGVTILPAGATSITLPVNPIDDDLLESDEDVTVTLEADAAYDLGSPTSATVVIESDEVLPTVSITASDSTATEAGTTSGTLVVTRNGGSTNPVTVNYSVGGNATAGSDYTALSGSVSLAANQNSATITVAPIDDNLLEADESVTVSLLANASYELGTPVSATVIIESDEVLPTINIAASDANAAEAGVDTGAFVITRSAGTQGALTVNYTVGGSASAGSDYTALSGSVSLAAGQNAATLTVTPVDDTAVEADETVVVTLSTSTAYGIGTSPSASVTIVSDDLQAIVSVTTSDDSATEAGTTTGSFTVSRSQNVAGALTVRYAMSGSASSGSDYAALSGTLNLAAGQTDATLLITPVDDNLVEADETVVLTLSADAAYSIAGSGTGTITIVSDDIQAPEPVTQSVVNLYDNKDGKNYSGNSDPIRDINSSSSNEEKVEILGDSASFWWEANYAATDPSLGDPSSVFVNIDYHPEEDWSGTFTAEYRVGNDVLASVTLPGNSQGNSETYRWDLSSVVTSASDIANGRVRFVNTDQSNGKKIFIDFSSLDAILSGSVTPPPPPPPPGPNQAPTVIANGPYTGFATIAMEFSSAGSDDSDGSIVSYLWNFGDGQTSDQVSPSHTYAEPGNYGVTLTLTDNTGASSSAETEAIVTAAPDMVEIAYDDFESGYGNFLDGGSDAKLYTGGSRAHQGSNAVNLQDDSSTSNIAYINPIDTTPYSSLEIGFWFYANSMESGEYFVVEFFDGSSWQNVATFTRGRDFENGIFSFRKVTLSAADYTFTAGANIRFRNVASSNADDIYLDEVRVSGGF